MDAGYCLYVHIFVFFSHLNRLILTTLINSCRTSGFSKVGAIIKYNIMHFPVQCPATRKNFSGRCYRCRNPRISCEASYRSLLRCDGHAAAPFVRWCGEGAPSPLMHQHPEPQLLFSILSGYCGRPVSQTACSKVRRSC